MAKFVPLGFDSARVIEGLHKAMGFGEPNRTDDKATFYKVSLATTTDEVDGEGLPFDPTATRAQSKTAITVPCAIEYFDRTEITETFGAIQPTRVVLTLLDAEYQQVKGFSYVAAGGDKYYYAKTEPPIALGSVDVWIVHASAQDER